jgi:chemotaxis signal transduction protein
LLEAEKTLFHDSGTTPVVDMGLEQQVLICEVDGTRQIAIPLEDVVCLEQIPSAEVEKSATGEVLQYRGEILPLRQLSQNRLESSATASDDRLLSVVIYRVAETWMGLLVDRIIDVARRPPDLRTSETDVQPGGPATVVGTAVVLGRVTDFLHLN